MRFIFDLNTTWSFAQISFEKAKFHNFKLPFLIARHNEISILTELRNHYLVAGVEHVVAVLVFSVF